MTASLLEPLVARTWAEVIAGWRRDAGFRAGFTRRLAAAPAEAIAWECAPVCATTRDARFEDVALDSPGLARVSAEPHTFAEHFDQAKDGIATFTNLGGDAVLVAPTPAVDGEAYPHLAAFVRHAPADQTDALWRAVAAALERRLAARSEPVWVSTAGLGVYWLHVRLDDRPKYYRHAPFVRWPPRA